MLTNSLAIGKVWHKRYTPKIHEFSYDLNCWLIDIDSYEQLDSISTLVSIDSLNLYTFDERKYIRDSSGKLPQKARQKFGELGAHLDGSEKIFLLGQLSNLGLYFSPLNLYLCYYNAQCRYILAEVSNTPWNERHYYLIDMDNQQYVVAKNFHVSPFWDINHNYHWQFDITPDKMYFQIDNYRDEQKVFSAGYKLEFKHFATHKSISKYLVKQPVSGWKIVSAIYYEALKIFLKKIPFVPYQKSRSN